MAVTKADGLGLLALDGNDTVGGTKYLLHFDDRRVLLDFGTNYAKHSRYYEEFLMPRTTAGLFDLITMGILPDARGLYRDDVQLPDLDLRGPEVGTVDAVLVTHAHLDHAGAVGLLRPEIPLATSALSAATLKAMQDCGKSTLGSETIYWNPRAPDERRGTSILATERGSDKMGRDLIVTEGAWGPDFEDFWHRLPEKEGKTPGAARRRKELQAGAFRKDLGDLGCRALPVDHSVKGAIGFVIETSRGPCVYPGDVRLHGVEGWKTEEFIQKARSPRPFALFMEGTNIAEHAEEVTREEDVARNVRTVLSGIAGEFAIADFGPRNIERLEVFLKAAREHGRRLVITPKDAYLLRAMHTVDAAVPLPGDDIVVFDSPKASDSAAEDEVFAEFAQSVVKAIAIRQSPGDYLVAFSFLDIKHLVDIHPDGGHYIYSSSEAFTEEQAIDFRRLKAWLDKFGLKSHGFWFDADQLRFSKGKKGLHASGHAPAADLERIVRTLNPEIIVPLHTEHPALFVERFGDDHRVVQPPLLEWTNL